MEGKEKKGKEDGEGKVGRRRAAGGGEYDSVWLSQDLPPL